MDNNSRILVKALTRVLCASLYPRRSRGTSLSALLRGQLYPLYWCWIVCDHACPWLSISQCSAVYAVYCSIVQWAELMSWADELLSRWAAWLHILHATAYYWVLYYCIVQCIVCIRRHHWLMSCSSYSVSSSVGWCRLVSSSVYAVVQCTIACSTMQYIHSSADQLSAYYCIQWWAEQLTARQSSHCSSADSSSSSAHQLTAVYSSI